MRRLRALSAVAPLAVLLMAAPAAAEWTGPCRPGVPAGTATPICHFWPAKLKWVDDGDTIDVSMPTSTGKQKSVRVRIIGIQAMEQSVYNSNPHRRRGECHALPATARLEQLLRKRRGRLRLGAQDPMSASGQRARRSVAVKVGSAWRDLGSILVAEGHALWLPYVVENAWNVTYSTLAQQAAARGLNLWDTKACGRGPNEGVPLRLAVSPDPRGDDFRNINGEQVTVQNLSPTVPVPLGGWWLRDSSLNRFEFPSWAVVPAGGSVTVYVGTGADASYSFYWGLDHPIFENALQDGRGLGDGAYLFDPQGDLRVWSVYPCYANCAPG
jgi:endonuclease YncB( thermonuclease family)